MANYCSERKGRKMPKIYHIRTLLWTYLVWAAINLWWAFSFCKPMGNQIFRQPIRTNNYWLAPYYWAMLNILPLYGLIRTLWECDMGGFIFFTVYVVVAGFAVVAGLLIKGRWARSLIIIGMSIWFFGAFCILGLGA